MKLDLEQVASDLAGELLLHVEGVDYENADAVGEAESIIAAALRRVVREAADAVMDYRIKCDMPPDGSRTAVLAAFGLSEEG